MKKNKLSQAFLMTMLCTGAILLSCGKDDGEVTPEAVAAFTFTQGTEGVVTFSNTSTNATSYAWDFGDGNSSKEKSPTHTYTKSGNYTVKLTATNAGGSDEETKTIIVKLEGTETQLIVNFTFTLDDEGVVKFTNTSENATGYTWDFGDGNKSNAKDTTYTFVENKDYAVKLTATNGAGESADTTKIITITNALPIASFEFTVDAQSAGGTVNFVNTSKNATGYAWDFGDGNASTDKSPTHTYAKDSTYTVKLTATNEGGSDEAMEEVTISLKGTIIPVMADFTFSIASGGVVTFQNTSTNATGYTWDFGDGNTSTDESPIHTYTQNGDFDVTLTATNGASQSDDTTKIITITNALPIASFEFTVDAQSAGGTVNFVNTSKNATGYAWDFGDGNTSTDESPTHTYTQNGDFDVTLTATNGASQSDVSTQTVTIVLAPVSDFTFSIASGGVVTFANASTNATGYTWDFGDGNTSTDASPTHTYIQNGDFDVMLTARNSAGASDVSTQTVTITNAVTIDIADLTLSIKENKPKGTSIVEIAAVVTNSNKTPVYSILSQNPAGVVALEGNRMVIADSSAFDFEKNKEITVEIQASVESVTETATFTISIGDDPDEAIYIPDANFKAVLVNNTNLNTDGDEKILESEARGYAGSIDGRTKSISDATGIEYFVNITSLDLGGNNLTAIDVSNNTKLADLRLNANNLQTLDVSFNTALSRLDAQENSLSTLDISKNTELLDLFVFENDLNSLDVSKNTKLRNLRLNGNNLQTLDVSKNTALTLLTLNDNQLTSIDVSNLFSLNFLWLQNNNLTKVNLKNGNNLQIMDLDLRGNDNLTCVQVNDPSNIPPKWNGKYDATVVTFQTTECSN